MAHRIGHGGHGGPGAEMRECIRECLSCHSDCLAMGGQHASPVHISLLFDCAEICQTSANVMLRGSSHHTRTCAVCAAVCRACEQAFRRIAGDDEQMLRCA